MEHKKRHDPSNCSEYEQKSMHMIQEIQKSISEHANLYNLSTMYLGQESLNHSCSGEHAWFEAYTRIINLQPGIPPQGAKSDP